MSTAVHAGHVLRPAVAARMAIDDDTRRREEDPFTDDFSVTWNAGRSSIVPGSRSISTDRVKTPCTAARTTPGASMCGRTSSPTLSCEESLAVHDDFYTAFADRLDRLAADGPFLVLDVHSYNHRRHGPDRPPTRCPTTRRSTWEPERSTGGGGRMVDVRRRSQRPTGSPSLLWMSASTCVSEVAICVAGWSSTTPRRRAHWRSSSRRCSWTNGPVSATTLTSASCESTLGRRRSAHPGRADGIVA